MTEYWPFNELGGFCLALSRDRHPMDMLKCYGAAPLPETLTRQEAVNRWRRGAGVSLLRAGIVGSWGFAFEEGSSISLEEEIQRRLSLGTKTYTLSDAPEAVITLLMLSRDGKILEMHEVGSPPSGEPEVTQSITGEVTLMQQELPDADKVHLGLSVMQRHLDVGLDASLLSGHLLTAFMSGS